MPAVFTGRAAGGGQRIDAEQVRRALALLVDPARGFQLQAAPYWSFATFAGGDLDAAVAWVQEQTTATGIYYALNPVPANLARPLLVGDVLFRRWLLIDVDRAKTAENKSLSGTEEEHAAALTLAADVALYLKNAGWPAPLLADSGNGAHLLYRLDLPNDGDSRALVRDFLKALAAKFDGDRGALGRECHDARRIAKLPGTLARKGPPSPERPHRPCRVLSTPALLAPVPAGRVRETTAALQARPAAVGNGHHAGGGGTGNGSPFTGKATNDADVAWARSAFEREVGRMATANAGGLNDQLFRSAAALGNFVAAGLLREEEVFDRLLAAARAAGADNPAKDADTLRRGLEKGKLEPRKRAAAPDPDAAQQPQQAPRILTLGALLAEVFAPPNWAIPGILSEGLTVLAGKPKLGKSWLALNLALTIAGGGKAMGTIDVPPGDVLYLALEDRWRRVQDRARKVLRGLGALGQEVGRRLYIAVEWPRQHQGGLEEIDRWLQSVERPALVIVDVWAKFRPPSHGSRSAYDQDYEHASAFKKVFDERQTSAMVLHHAKKAAADDVFDEISGTLGFSGSADGSMVLIRTRNDHEAELALTGRDIEEKRLALEFDPETFCWTCSGSAEERTSSKLKESVLNFLRANPDAVFSVSEIGDRLNVPREKAHYLRCLLLRMCDEGLLRKRGQGRYCWPVQESGDERAF